MPSKEEIKTKLCIDNATMNYPLGHFVEWIEQRQNQEVLRQLEQIQLELHADERAWREAAANGKATKEQDRASRWSFYCAQVKAYYQGMTAKKRRCG